MAILNAGQIDTAARKFSQNVFVATGAVANLSLDDIKAGITAIDTAMASTPAVFSAAHSGSANVGAGIGAAVAAAVPNATTPQMSLMLVFWTEQVTGVS